MLFSFLLFSPSYTHSFFLCFFLPFLSSHLSYKSTADAFTKSHPGSPSVFLYFFLVLSCKIPDSLIKKCTIIQVPEEAVLAFPYSSPTKFFQQFRQDSIISLPNQNSHNLCVKKQQILLPKMKYRTLVDKIYRTKHRPCRYFSTHVLYLLLLYSYKKKQNIQTHTKAVLYATIAVSMLVRPGCHTHMVPPSEQYSECITGMT